MNRFKSNYSEHLESFLLFKIAMGFEEDSFIRVLKLIDQSAVKFNAKKGGISRDFAEHFSKKDPNISQKFHYEKVRMLANVSGHINEKGIESHSPPVIRYPGSNFQPFIFTSDELASLIYEVDHLELKLRNSNSPLICMPALIRLLIGTGLRIGEARDLFSEDVDLVNGLLTIRKSKNNKERIVPVSESLLTVLKNYASKRDLTPFVRRCNNFFVTINGREIGLVAIRNWFHISLNRSKIYSRETNKKPRLHDLRHTFAVYSLVQMCEIGLDIYTSLPILSTYLGHSHIKSTEGYVRLTSFMFPHLSSQIENKYINFYPQLK